MPEVLWTPSPQDVCLFDERLISREKVYAVLLTREAKIM